MKLTNSTHWSDPFLRRMLAWVCRNVGYRASDVKRADFKPYGRCYRGRAYWSRRIIVRVGPPAFFPVKADTRPGMQNEVIADQAEALVAITAHEVAHLCQYRDRRSERLNKDRKTEHDARWHEVQALRAFRANREALLAKWAAMPMVVEDEPETVALPMAVAVPTATKPTTSIVERRAAKAEADLARWQRKLKLAQTKVRGYKRRVAYYSRKQTAAKRSP